MGTEIINQHLKWIESEYQYALQESEEPTATDVIRGDKTEVNIKDSVVNRSDVGGDAERC